MPDRSGRAVRSNRRRIVPLARKSRFPVPFSRWVQVFLGIVFAFASFAKGFDVVRFGRQIEAIIATLGIDRTPLLEAASLAAAIIVIIIELYLGAALITGYKSAQASLLSVLTLIVLSCIPVWLIIQGEKIDCGCFGIVVSRSANQTLASDLFLLILALIGASSKRRVNRGRLPARLIVILGVVWTASMYYYPHRSSALRAGSEVTHLLLSELKLPKDARYIWMIDVDCRSCRKLTPVINAISATAPGLLFGLAPATPGRIEEFVYDFRIGFPILAVPEKRYIEFSLQDGTLICIEDNKISQIWSPEVLSRIDIPKVQK